MKKSLMLALLFLLGFGFISSKAPGDNPKIVAHRGAYKNNDLPENSIASLRAAANEKIWGSEFDVHLTQDDKLVVNHDDDFMGIHIPTATYKELLTKKHANGEPIPTLQEYLEEGRKHPDLKLILEIKTNPIGVDRSIEATRQIFKTVQQFKMKDQVQWIAFSFDVCLALRKLDKSATILYLEGDKSPQEIEAAGLSGLDYHQSVFRKHPEWIEEARKRGLITNVWTVDTEEDLQYFIDQDVDFITTNEPELLAQLIANP